MSTVFFITDGSGVGGDNAELARSFKCVVTGPRSQPAARWARTSGEARLEREEKQRVSRPGRGIRQFGPPTTPLVLKLWLQLLEGSFKLIYKDTTIGTAAIMQDPQGDPKNVLS